MAAVARYYSPADPNNRALEAAMELSMINISNSNISNGLLNLAAAAAAGGGGGSPLIVAPPPPTATISICPVAAAPSSVEGYFDYWDGVCAPELDGSCNNKTPSSMNITQCVAVPSSEHVAEIVGKQGCKIKALRAKTNTYIKTPVRGEDPVFSISGRPDHVNTAKWEIITAAEHFSQIRAARSPRNPSLVSSPSDKVTIYVRVPYRVVGLVVGPRGATVKRIQQITRTFIVTPSRDKEPCFEVRGTPENVERARKEIESYIVLRTGKSSFSEEDGGGGGGSSFDVCRSASGPPSINELTRQMQQCQLMEATGQYPPDMLSSPGGGSGAIDVPGVSNEMMDKSQEHFTWSNTGSATIFSGMRFTPPDLSYKPVPATLLTPEGVGGKPQPLSPTGSYESNSSDGFAVASPKQPSPAMDQVRRYCTMCKSAEELLMAALLPCGHNLFCQTCAHYISCSIGSCPLCSAQVTNVMHV